MKPLPVSIGVPIAAAAMVVLIVASNFLVQIPINAWLTWGALVYPICFLVTDLTNRAYGPPRARRVVYIGFAVAVVLSAVVASPRIAVASGTAFVVAQLLDIFVFDRLRRSAWWRAPLASSVIGSAVDTTIFYSLAFAFTGLPWMPWAAGNFAVKVAMALMMLLPFRALMPAFGGQPRRA